MCPAAAAMSMSCRVKPRFEPSGNIDPDLELQVLTAWLSLQHFCMNAHTYYHQQTFRARSLPDCVPVCDSMPPSGYLGSHETGWRCGPGYLGTATASCTVTEISGSCIASFQASGCLAIQPCVPKAADNPCMFDMESCKDAAAGSTCEISCKHPFRGSATSGSCPADNTDPLRMVDADMPECVVKAPCPDPADGIPEEYRYTGNILDPVACSPGFAGPAKRECVAKLLPNSTDTCFVEGNFTGCARIVPCMAPEIASNDCELNTTCGPILVAGETCETSCNRPLEGQTTVARCPADNTDPAGPATWTRPNCTCPDPDIIPPGYAPALGVWECLAGYVGRAEKLCQCQAEEPLLRGCYSPVICGSAGFSDTDTRRGFVGGRLQFGPSALDGIADEDGVYSYQVFWANDCGAALPELAPILTVPPQTRGGASNPWPDGCCKTDVYSVNIPATELPAGARQLLLLVLTSSGQAPDGLAIPLEDSNYEDTVTVPPKGTVGSGANHRWASTWLILMACFVHPSQAS